MPADSTVNMKGDAWFAGFADGEGSFQITPRHPGYYLPLFTIGLRADDLPVLEALRVEFGGRIRVYVPKGRDNPAAYWWVIRKRDLAGLVEYFDEFPLRAKKARDYQIWRRAALAFCAKGGYAAELLPLREALMAGRKFDAETNVPAEVASPQLALVA